MPERHPVNKTNHRFASFKKLILLCMVCPPLFMDLKSRERNWLQIRGSFRPSFFPKLIFITIQYFPLSASGWGNL